MCTQSELTYCDTISMIGVREAAQIDIRIMAMAEKIEVNT